MPTDYSPHLIEAVRASRRKLTPAQRAKPVRVPATMYPYAIERRYAKRIYSYVSPLIEAVNKYVEANGEALLRGDVKQIESVYRNPLDGSVTIGYRQDAIPGVGFRLLTATLTSWVAQYFPDEKSGGSQVYLGVGSEADAVKLFADAQWAKQTAAILGVSFNTAEQWWGDLRTRWADDNYRLIKSFATDYIKQVNYATEQAILNGTSYATLKKQIQALGDLSGDSKTWSRNKARLIARDQIGKLNGQINQSQQTEVGVEFYTWLTTGDKRVRPTHAAMEGLLGRWDDASVYSADGGKTWLKKTSGMVKAHPGQEIQCRCTAIPYWVKILAIADYGLQAA